MIPASKEYFSVILRIIKKIWKAEKRTHFAYVLHVGEEWVSKAQNNFLWCVFQLPFT